MEGYHKIAMLMAHINLFIFRKFSRLNALNLLYLQAELIHLEKDLNDIAERDEQAGLPHYAKDWLSLSESERDGNSEQWQKMLEVRKKLREYSENPPLTFSAQKPLAFSTASVA